MSENELRAAFEKWATHEGSALIFGHPNLLKDAKGYYEVDAMEDAWVAWQAGYAYRATMTEVGR